MGMGEALRIIEELASCGVFLERELNKIGISRNWLPLAKTMGCATPRGYGVWSHPSYEPTRYELVQLRFPHVVFWGPSALWLLGQRLANQTPSSSPSTTRDAHRGGSISQR